MRFGDLIDSVLGGRFDGAEICATDDDFVVVVVAAEVCRVVVVAIAFVCAICQGEW